MASAQKIAQVACPAHVRVLDPPLTRIYNRGDSPPPGPDAGCASQSSSAATSSFFE